MKPLPNPILNLVSETGEAQFDAAGQFLGRPVLPTDRNIPAGLVTRLTRYAHDQITETGIIIQDDWEVEVEEIHEVYHVTFHTHTGAQITVQGILTNNGWPCLDHGLCLDR